MVSRGEESIMKANERDSRTEQERFIDRMLKEILGGQRNPATGCPRRANWPRSTICARRTYTLP